MDFLWKVRTKEGERKRKGMTRVGGLDERERDEGEKEASWKKKMYIEENKIATIFFSDS